MDESERGRGNGGKEGRRTEEGTGELLVMAGERERRRPRQQDEGGNQFRPSSEEGGCHAAARCLYLNWGLLGLIGRNDRWVGRGPSCACPPPPRSLGRLVIEFALQHATHPGSPRVLQETAADPISCFGLTRSFPPSFFSAMRSPDIKGPNDSHFFPSPPAPPSFVTSSKLESRENPL